MIGRIEIVTRADGYRRERRFRAGALTPYYEMISTGWHENDLLRGITLTDEERAEAHAENEKWMRDHGMVVYDEVISLRTTEEWERLHQMIERIK